jgi:hypothetical protein
MHAHTSDYDDGQTTGPASIPSLESLESNFIVLLRATSDVLDYAIILIDLHASERCHPVNRHRVSLSSDRQYHDLLRPSTDLEIIGLVMIAASNSRLICQFATLASFNGSELTQICV